MAMLASPAFQYLPDPQLERLFGAGRLGAASHGAAVLVHRAFSHPGRHLPSPLTQPAARKYDWSDCALLHRGRGDHVVLSLAAWTAAVEVVSFRNLRRRDRTLLAQHLHRPKLEEHAARPVRWRKGIR